MTKLQSVPTYITGISGKSNSQRFENWQYICILPSFTSRLRNYQKLRYPERRAFAWLSTLKQIRAPVFSGPSIFFLWGYVKEWVLVPPLPLDIDELKLTIVATIETIDRNVLERWAGLQTGQLSGHEWRSHWASLGYVKLSEFVIQMALVTTA
jgi:hypothetical protein